MNKYTIIILYKWDVYKNDIKKMFNDNNLRWNTDEIKHLNIDELKNILSKFKIENYFKLKENTSALSGVYLNNENNETKVKIIKIEGCDNVILIHKGLEKTFYTEFLKKCANIGCLIIKIIDNEIIFKNRINIELLKNINDIEKEKEIKTKNFIEKISILNEYNNSKFSDEFKNKFINCIKNEHIYEQ